MKLRPLPCLSSSLYTHIQYSLLLSFRLFFSSYDPNIIVQDFVIICIWINKIFISLAYVAINSQLVSLNIFSVGLLSKIFHPMWTWHIWWSKMPKYLFLYHSWSSWTYLLLPFKSWIFYLMSQLSIKRQVDTKHQV